MPKENINCADGLRVVVGWEAGKDVQIATIDPQGRALPEGPSNGWFGTLDRAGCNRLIRSVRLARDKAFGADA